MRHGKYGMTDLKTLFGDVYKGRRVLVTGHTGFKGSWLSLWLSSLGAEVHGYALEPDSFPNLFEAASVEDKMASSTIADIRDHKKLLDSIRKIEPEIIFHLAAQPLVRLSYREPRETYETNVMGSVNLLEAVRAADSVKVCQVITSDKCYENREWVYAYRENDPMGGHDPYSNSKGCVELVVASYRDSFFLPNKINEHGVSLSSSRAGNVIGGGDWAEDRIIPDCVRALSIGETIDVRNPHAIRPWQHVLEPLSGYLWLAAMQWRNPGMYEGAWNFGPSGSGNVNVGHIVELALRSWGGGEWRAPECESESLHEANFLKLDITKANSLLSWEPLFSVSEAVAETMAWYRMYQSQSEDVQVFTLGQIENYCHRASDVEIAWANKGVLG